MPGQRIDNEITEDNPQRSRGEGKQYEPRP
jgi:hypothetical protein